MLTMAEDNDARCGQTGRVGLRRYVGPKRLTLLLLFFSFACAAWYLRQRGLLTVETLHSLVLDYPVSAPLIFVVFYAATVLFMIPSLPLNLGAGFLWGPFLGSVYSVVGSTLGAVLVFSFARTSIGQPLTRRFENRLLRWLVDELATNGWRVVAFVRINPVFPSGPTNYLFGLTGLRFWTYLWSTAVFMYPLCVGFAYLGQVVGGFVLDTGWTQALRLVMAASAVVTLGILGRLLFRHYCGIAPQNGEDAS
jgi:uncharacterized membrane protein YdjX (TVP38/TMEM64 family)